MELVLGHLRLIAPGGSESYLLTVGEQLERLGHEVTIFAVEAGEMAGVASERGLRVVTDEHELPPECDGVLAQDGVVSLTLADRYPGTAQVFVAHATGFDLQRPVQLDGVISAVVALNDRTVTRLEGLAIRQEVVRLRQPIDTRRFKPRFPPRAAPERVLLLSNYLNGPVRDTLAHACADAGMKFEHVGFPERRSTTPETDIAGCDITVAQGRAALEGMSCGRAVYVLDHYGGDGWVTPDSYAALEANGFAGMAYHEPVDGERLGRDLAAYLPEMGEVNRQLVCGEHHAMDHACELVSLFRRLSPGAPPANAPLREMARLVRLQWNTENRNTVLASENEWLRGQLEHESKQALAAQEQVSALKGSRRYRLAGLLARPFEALRRRR